ncbi:MAG TPA: phosphotransferase [Marmoricola sp.]|nr:phosphotransferase [Marmoricola sp.]HNN47490.1 phosphotransferase [Marmoricola sp.]HNO39058.1 phosphotransferase [Marmoricola sp.]
MAWQPDPSWIPITGTHGPTTEGIWTHQGRIIKRIRPGESDWGREHVGYWRREAEVAANPWLVDGPGLRPVGFHLIEEDDLGVTIHSEMVLGPPPTNLQVAAALGRFALAEFTPAPWYCNSLLATRLNMVERHGGWDGMSHTSIADLCADLWQRRERILEAIDRGPQGRLHGDPIPKNFLTPSGSDVITIDWQCFGVGPVGLDLGYWALSAREDFEVLIDVFIGTHPERASISLAARTMLVYTAITKANQALRQAVRTGMSLAAIQKHPSVAPHLRALQRHLPQIERLLADTQNLSP